MKKIYIKGHQHISETQGCWTTFLVLPTFAIMVSRHSFVLIAMWMFWSVDICLDRGIKE
jgi:hypothetical protein